MVTSIFYAVGIHTIICSYSSPECDSSNIDVATTLQFAIEITLPQFSYDLFAVTWYMSHGHMVFVQGDINNILLVQTGANSCLVM